MELEFREVEFQNAAIEPKNVTIGLKNATIGHPEYGAITLIKNFAGKRHYRVLKRHYMA